LARAVERTAPTVGAASVSETETRVDLGNYRVLAKVMDGHYSQIYRVLEPNTQREMALKVLLPHAAESRYHVQAIAREANISMRLVHRNIIRAYRFFPDARYPFFVMEYFRGQNLRVRIYHHHDTVYNQPIRIIRQISEGLAYMHGKRIVHKDLKPENVLVDNRGLVKIIDFALADEMRPRWWASLVGRKRIAGTRSYMSPEQIRGQELDPRADIYALGATIYEIMCRRPPFTADTGDELLAKHLREEAVPMRVRNPQVSEGLNQLVLKMLAKDPNDRPVNMGAVIETLTQIEPYDEEA
jgi:serine/threonine protein kinase